jgi:pimeloyl-ACP methyl ester carboxylesterase
MQKRPLRDVVIILPGITGSILQRDGRDVWAASGQAAWNAVKSLGRDLRDLELRGSEDDGVEATSIMPSAHIVPGLVRIDGYSQLISMLEDSFEIIRDEHGQALNLLPFPYDWRQDNRKSARRLKDVVNKALSRWRTHQKGEADAKAILIGHSMGGLVSRYWIECLEGWRDCRALITFGTPHRGSPNAVGYLANGYKKLFIDLTAAMRSFPSVHQLLPRYKAVVVDGVAKRITELPSMPNLNNKLVADGLLFHQEIEEAVTINNNDYGDKRYVLLPFVGTRQQTMQSALLTNGVLSLSPDLPPGIDQLLGDGDGTVPRASAIPIELSNEYRDTFAAERHGTLQSNANILADVRERLAQLQIRGLQEVRSAVVSGPPDPALSTRVEDAYVDEPVSISLETPDSKTPYSGATAIISEVAADSTAPHEFPFQRRDNGWELVIEDLPEGLYRVEMRVDGGGPWAPQPVHEIFQVVSGAP